jgi:hypothetical protein
MTLTLFAVKERKGGKGREIILKLRAGLGNSYIANREGNGAIIMVKKEGKL